MILMGGIAYTCEHVINEEIDTVVRSFYLHHAPEGFDRMDIIMCWLCETRFRDFVKHIPGLEDSEIFES